MPPPPTVITATAFYSGFPFIPFVVSQRDLHLRSLGRPEPSFDNVPTNSLRAGLSIVLPRCLAIRLAAISTMD